MCVQLLRSNIVKDNAIGSIFYGVGFSTPGVLAEAFTGVDTKSGRRLLQDPYHLTSKVGLKCSSHERSWWTCLRLQ